MGMKFARFKRNEELFLGVVEDNKIYKLQTNPDSFEKFLEIALVEAKASVEEKNLEEVELSDVVLLSPIPTPSQIICQGVNYSIHRQETGMDDQKPPFNMIFSKAPSSVCGPNDAIMRPDNVKLLDYEIELGLVIRKPITQDTVITEDNFLDYIAGLVLTNDISARDVQLTQLQWLKGKSYRTFCPVGPYFYLLEQEDVAKIADLKLELRVNGEIRQEASTDQLLYKPIETLNELAQIMDLQAGDLVLTGTPGGVAMQLSADEMNCMTSLVSKFGEKVEVIQRQHTLGNYLKDGDIIEATIASTDGSIDLGKQQNVVKTLQSISV
ncbi:2-keto-4-pentenoate hydratase/2-oxohepta-3-ene-1,7-dioic acid hydratase in catechol pathway [Ureibacillus chungkukjangi]|uniref:2-keto-4-pentenoate hydratase/2-oxohepta-3-ene-1,7-dioic acid hydratase in catechol pathway n=2 Tax=Ureibacillus chungkukjangi TaxID=1202712 RepID=A0A318TV32_9BACL|nr:2-keto-4-pentenoate hydratase/2-oxohepta-3-ene-1,7-dioic acid hydratase in catechol pathway [Ureibacillus chungkukjangi]